MLRHLKIAIKIACATLLLTGAVYPLALTAAANIAFPREANGSLIYDRRGRLLGSELIGQRFTHIHYFHPRPSATGHDASHSAASNLGPTSRALKERVASDIEAFRQYNRLRGERVPADAVTFSASGLDPHITPENALSQLERVADARSFPREMVWQLVLLHTEKPCLGVLGTRRVNVLWLNIELDRQDNPSWRP